MLRPTGNIKLKALKDFDNIKSVKLLGAEENIKWKNKEDYLEIQKPKQLPDFETIVFEIECKE